MEVAAKLIKRAGDLIRGIDYGYLQPLRVKYADGGVLLAMQIQSALRNETAVIRIKSDGLVVVNESQVGSSYGTRSLGRLLEKDERDKREIIIVGEPSISGRKIATFVEGLNTGYLKEINILQGCAMVFIKDYNLLQMLHRSEVPTVKLSPKLELTDQGIKDLSNFFKRFPSLLRDFRWFNPIQRTVVVKLACMKLLDGIFNFWEVLGPEGKTRLLDDLSKIDAELISRNTNAHQSYIKSSGKDESSNVAQIKGQLSLPIMDDIPDFSTHDLKQQGVPLAKQMAKMAAAGRKYKASGKLGVVIMAAGAAARFGQGPKALVKVDGKRSFMQIAAEDVREASRAVKKDIHLFVMVSPLNWEVIKRHFNDNEYFGLDPEKVIFFEQSDILPKILPSGNLALTINKRGIDFAPTGHGSIIKAMKIQILAKCRELGIKTLLIKNIDNLGSTVRDASYDEVLGFHLGRINSGRRLTVELVWPKVAVDPITQKKKLLDKGGGAMSLDGRNVLVELLAVPAELTALMAKKEQPFNTLSMTAEVEAIEKADPEIFPWYITHKDFTVGVAAQFRRYQFEQLLGDFTHQEPTNFVIVEREGEKGRFIAVKLPKDMSKAAEAFLTMENLKDGK